MNLHEYIENLNKVESKRRILENMIKSWVRIKYCGEWWELRITYEESNMSSVDYAHDFDTVDDLLQSLESFITGAMLCKHIEI